MGDFDEAFKLKAKELLEILKNNTIPEDTRKDVRGLFDQATVVYTQGQVEEALVLVVRAIQRAKKG